MNTLNLYNFFETAKEDTFFAIVVEEKAGFNIRIKPDKTEERLRVCKNLLDASYVNYQIEQNSSQIVCIINYNNATFSTRAFVGQFRQVLYNLDPESHICVFYSEGFSDRELLFAEVLFVLERTDYGLLFGKSRAIPASFIHLCEESTRVMNFAEINTLIELLRSRSFDKFKEEVDSLAAVYSLPYNEENAYHMSQQYEHLLKIYSAVTWFFLETGFETPFIRLTLTDLLVKHNGVAGFIHEAERNLDIYISDFSPTPPSERKQKHIDEMLEYINDNMSTVSLASLSSHFGLTSEYICRLFKTQYNMNFTDYLKRKRFELATEILRTDTDISVTELCRQLGYQSRSYFQNIFKKEYGITPDAYRKQYHKRTSD